MDRRMMMAYIMSHQSRLPAEFQEVEYIESTGTQYIDSGVIGKDTLKVDCKFMITQTLVSQQQAIYGAYKQIGSENYFYVLLMRSPNVARVGTSGNQATSTNVSTNYLYETSLENGKYIENGIEYTFTPSQSFELTGVSIYLFSRNQIGMSPTKARIYSSKIYDNNVLLRDFVPCYRKADNVAGLYDLVNGVFYTNAGTGTFTKGPDV